MAPGMQQRARDTVPLLTTDEQIERYQQKIENTLRCTVQLQDQDGNYVSVRQEIQQVADQAEILAKELLQVDPSVPNFVAVDRVNSRWISLIQRKELQAFFKARDNLYNFQCAAFSRFVENTDITALLNLLGKACDSFLKFAPSHSGLADPSISTYIFRSQRTWVLHYYHCFAHPLEWRESSFFIHRHALLLSLSRTGYSLAGAMRLLIEIGRTVQRSPLKSLLQANSLRIQNRISKETKISILKVCAFYGSLLGFPQNRSAAHEMVLQGVETGVQSSLSHRQRLNYFPRLSSLSAETR